MVCAKCGAQLYEGSKFCTKCGQKVESGPTVCKNCGSPINPGDAFCANCGTPAQIFGNAGQQPTQQTTSQTAPQEFHGSFIKPNKTAFIGTSGEMEEVCYSSSCTYRMTPVINPFGFLSMTRSGIYFSKTLIGDMVPWEKLFLGEKASFFIPFSAITSIRDGKAGLISSLIISCGEKEYNLVLPNKQAFLFAFNTLHGSGIG